MLRINSCQWSTIVGTSLSSHPTSHPVQDSGILWKRGWKECRSERMGREVWIAGASIWTGQDNAVVHVNSATVVTPTSSNAAFPNILPFRDLGQSQVYAGCCSLEINENSGGFAGHATFKVIWVLRQIVSEWGTSQGQQEWLSPLCSSGQRNMPIWLTVLESCWMCAWQSKWVIALCFLSASLLRARERKVN